MANTPFETKVMEKLQPILAEAAEKVKLAYMPDRVVAEIQKRAAYAWIERHLNPLSGDWGVTWLFDNSDKYGQCRIYTVMNEPRFQMSGQLAPDSRTFALGAFDEYDLYLSMAEVEGFRSRTAVACSHAGGLSMTTLMAARPHVEWEYEAIMRAVGLGLIQLPYQFKESP